VRILGSSLPASSNVWAAAVCVMVGALAGLASPVVAKEAVVSPKAVRALLERRAPPGADELRDLGLGADTVLVGLASDATLDVPLRARATGALAHFASPAARRFLGETVRTKAFSKDAGERLLVRKAAVALGWLGGSDVPVRVEPLLDSPDADVRLDAVLALGLTRSQAAVEILRRRMPGEKDDRVRAQMSRQLGVLDQALQARPAAPAPG
jgi:HEAT repeat protein